VHTAASTYTIFKAISDNLAIRSDSAFLEE
jgi:hypothetical protein